MALFRRNYDYKPIDPNQGLGNRAKRYLGQRGVGGAMSDAWSGYQRGVENLREGVSGVADLARVGGAYAWGGRPAAQRTAQRLLTPVSNDGLDWGEGISYAEKRRRAGLPDAPRPVTDLSKPVSQLRTEVAPILNRNFAQELPDVQPRTLGKRTQGLSGAGGGVRTQSAAPRQLGDRNADAAQGSAPGKEHIFRHNYIRREFPTLDQDAAMALATLQEPPPQAPRRASRAGQNAYEREMSNWRFRRERAAALLGNTGADVGFNRGQLSNQLMESNRAEGRLQQGVDVEEFRGNQQAEIEGARNMTDASVGNARNATQRLLGDQRTQLEYDQMDQRQPLIDAQTANYQSQADERSTQLQMLNDPQYYLDQAARFGDKKSSDYNPTLAKRFEQKAQQMMAQQELSRRGY